MAVSDSITLNPGIGGADLAVDTVSGVKHQRSKMQFGATGYAQDVDAENPLPVTSQVREFMELVDGNITGLSHEITFGINRGLMAGVAEDIWSYGGDYNWIATATILEALSSSANDAAGGTGAQMVQIWGLDAAYAEQTEVVTLNGTTAVQTTGTYLRVSRVMVLTAGSGGTAAGTITVQITGGGAVVAECAVDDNLTEMCLYTVPAGKTLYILNFHGSATDAATKADVGVTMRVRPFGGVFNATFMTRLATDGTCTFQRDSVVPMRVPEKSDIVFRAHSTRDNTVVAASFVSILKDN